MTFHVSSPLLSLCRRAALQKWKDKSGPNATYRALVTAFVRAGKGDCAEAVCKVLGESGKSRLNYAQNCHKVTFCVANSVRF